MGNEGVDIIWDVSPVSSTVTVLSQRGEFNNVIRVNRTKEEGHSTEWLQTRDEIWTVKEHHSLYSVTPSIFLNIYRARHEQLIVLLIQV